MPDNCPKCGVSLQGPPIPEDMREHYNPTSTHFSRMIDVEIQGVYDGGLFHVCPDCGGKWHRWPEGHELRKLAEKYVLDPNWGTN